MGADRMLFGKGRVADGMAVWKRLSNWTYELFDRDTAAEQFGVFEPLVRQWHEKRAGRAMPSWSDYDFYDFKGWHGWIAVQEIIAEPFDLKCRLWGTMLTEILGSDHTGKLFSEIGSSYTENDLAYLAEVCRGGSIGRSHGTLDWLKKGHKSVAFLDLPLSTDGSNVDRLLCVLSETTAK